MTQNIFFPVHEQLDLLQRIFAWALQNSVRCIHEPEDTWQRVSLG